MTETRPSEQPTDRQSPASDAAPIPVVDTAPPLAPADHGHSPWWTAPSGKPFSIPDFAHEFSAFLAALLNWLFPGPAPVPVPVKATRRRP